MDDRVELPDFEFVLKLVDEIGSLSKRVMELELTLDIEESRITLVATSDPKYLVGGKPPSQTFIDNSWKVTGFEGELVPLRTELIDNKWKLEVAKSTLDLYKKMIDIWRTQSANERTAVI